MRKAYLMVVENLTGVGRRNLDDNSELIHKIIRELSHMDSNGLDKVLSSCMEINSDYYIRNDDVNWNTYKEWNV